MSDYLTSEEVGKSLGISARQVQRLAREGRIPFVRRGRVIRIPKAAWEQYLAAQTEAALAVIGGSRHEG